MARKDITDRIVCEVFAEPFTVDGKPREVRLSEATGEPEKVVFRAMERAYSRGLIECGVSLRSGWLTPKGKAVLNLSE